MAAPGFHRVAEGRHQPDEENMKSLDTAILDYVDFKIEIKQAGVKNRGLQTALAQIEARYSRKQRMVEKGTISEDAGKILGKQKVSEMAASYADHVIVGWEGKYKGKKLPDFSRAAVIEFLTSSDNEDLFADVIMASVEQGNFEAEAQKEDGEELKKPSSGKKNTDTE